MPVNLKIDASFKPKEIWLMFVDLLGIAYRLRVIHWYQRQIPTKNNFQNLIQGFSEKIILCLKKL